MNISRGSTIVIRLFLGLALATMVVLLVIPATYPRPSFLDGRLDDDVFFEAPALEAIVRYDSGVSVAVNQVTVRFKFRPSPSRVERLARSVGGRVVGQSPKFRTYHFEVPTRTVGEVQQIARWLKRQFDVDYAGPCFLPETELSPRPRDSESPDGPAGGGSR